MSALQVIQCDPTSAVGRSYACRIPDYQWQNVRRTIVRLHQMSVPRNSILAELHDKYGFTPTPRQLWRKMREWGLYVYHVRDKNVATVGRGRSAVPMSIPDPMIGISGRPGRYYSWSLDLPDYHKHKLWSLCIFPISRTQHLSPRPSSIHAVEAWVVEETALGADYRQHLPKIFEYSCYVHQMLNAWTEEVLNLSRASSLVHSLQEWLSCPLADLQALTWMFWVILDLALRSSITINSEGIPVKHAKHHEETHMHLNAAGALLGIANRKVQTEEQKKGIEVLANALESSQRTFGQSYFQLSIATR